MFPALLVVPFVAGRFRGKEPDRGIRLAWAAAGTWLAINLPFILAAPGSWWEFFRYNGGRFADWDSLWYVACERSTGQTCSQTDLINGASLVMFVAWAGLVWLLKARRDPGFARWTLGFPILVVFLLTNKVYSPQFSLWLLPWFALAFPNLWLFVAFEAADVAVFVTRFSWFGRYTGVEGGLSGIPLGVFEIAVGVRAAILVLCVVDWVRARQAAVAGAADERPGAARRGGPLPDPERIAISKTLRRAAARIITPCLPPGRPSGSGSCCSCVAGTLAVGHALKSPCAHGDWSDGRPFTCLCHTDIIPLFGNEQLSEIACRTSTHARRPRAPATSTRS